MNLSPCWSGPWRRAAAILLFSSALVTLSAPVDAADHGCPALLDHSFPELLTGKPVSLCEYRGRVLLVVNTASACGFTPQYEQLEAIHRKLSGRGLVIVGFPSNDFGQQERGSSREIAEFCKVNYGVSFPMFERTIVAGSKANVFYRQLADRSGTAPGWNFHKYLIDRSGNRVTSFDTTMRPDDPRLVREIERLLSESPKSAGSAPVGSVTGGSARGR